MAFESSLYEEILKDYEAQRMMHKREREQRLAQVYALDARLEELDAQMQTVGAQAMMSILEKPAEAKSISERMKSQIAQLTKEREQRLAMLGFTRDYTNLHFNCKLCEDTGYCEGKVCDCLRNAAAKLARKRADIAPMLQDQNFARFDLSLFSEENKELMCENLSLAKDFVNEFPNDANLLFYGDTGCGKTFLSSCIANALLEKNVHVVYKSAVRLFTDYIDYVFNRGDSAGIKNELERVMHAELLIIDDLGTEAINQHTISYLFQLINERGMQKRPTIINTNLTLDEIGALYSNRISSRLLEQYEMVEFANEDIRLKKQL